MVSSRDVKTFFFSDKEQLLAFEDSPIQSTQVRLLNAIYILQL